MYSGLTLINLRRFLVLIIIIITRFDIFIYFYILFNSLICIYIYIFISAIALITAHLFVPESLDVELYLNDNMLSELDEAVFGEVFPYLSDINVSGESCASARSG